MIPQGSKIVHVLTGNGLKDPTTAMEQSPVKPVRIENDYDVFASAVTGAQS